MSSLSFGRGRKLIVKIAFAIPFALLLIVAAFFAGMFVNSFKSGLFPPTYASDSEVTKLIENWGINIPEGAQKLSILEYGFIGSDVWISMEVPIANRDSLMS